MAPSDRAANSVHDETHRKGEPQRNDETEPRLVRKCATSDTSDDEGVGGPDRTGDRGDPSEPMPGVPDGTAGERHDGSPTRDEPTDDDQPGAEAVERPGGPGQMLAAALGCKESPLDPGAEVAPDHIAEIVADERGGRRKDDEKKKTGVEAPGGRDAERNDRCLAGEDGGDCVE